MTISSAKRALYLAIGAAMFAGVQANAGEIKFDSRFDYLSQTYNTAKDLPSNSGFNVQRFRLDFNGKLGELTTYRARVDVRKLNDPANTTLKREGTSSAIDMAFLSRQLFDGFKVHFGKLPTAVAGWEGGLSSGDIYLTTQAWNEAAAVFYSAGVGMTYNLGDHVFTAMVGNPGEDTTVTYGGTARVNQHTYLYGAKYTAKLLEGSLQPVVTFHSEDRSGERTYRYYGLGGRYTAETFEVEADYLMNTFKNRTTTGETDSTNTAYLLARYKFQGIMPFVKYEMTTTEVKGAAGAKVETDITGLSAGVEYVPVKDEFFRYHLVYTDRTEKADTAGAQKLQSSQIIAGVRILADILK